jgi:alpha-ribazole phosphatase
MRLYLIRHLAPEIAKGLCYGRSDLDVAPDALARALPALRAQLPAGLPVIASPLRRCASLAHALSQAPRFDPRLVELDFGDWELLRWDDIDGVDAWAADVVHYRPGGGESVAVMAGRISDFYDALMADKLPAAIVVCHAGAMRLLAARQRGLAPEAMARAAAERPHAIAYGEILILDCV